MRIKQFIIAAIAIATFAVSSYAQDESRRGGQPRGAGFTPTLSGTWQLCTLTPGQDGQPQLSLLPMLKVFGNDGQFQNIGIPNEGSCFIEKMGNIEKTSDSTYVEKLIKMRRDSVENAPVTVKYRFRGPMWLIINYTAPGQDKPTEELWMRVRQKGSEGRGPRGNGEHGQRMGGQRPQGNFQGGNFRGQRGQRGQNRPQQVNAFEEDDNSDF